MTRGERPPANRLREARTAADMTQEGLARVAGCTLNTVSCVERGDQAPSAALALRIARALGTTVEAIWGPVESGEGR